jgi:hypothetical protein
MAFECHGMDCVEMPSVGYVQPSGGLIDPRFGLKNPVADTVYSATSEKP